MEETIKKNPVQEEAAMVDLSAEEIEKLQAQIGEQTGRAVRLERCGYTDAHRRAAAASARSAGENLRLLRTREEIARRRMAAAMDAGVRVNEFVRMFQRAADAVSGEIERKLLLDLQAMGVRPIWFQRSSRLEKYIEKSAAYAKRCADRRMKEAV